MSAEVWDDEEHGEITLEDAMEACTEYIAIIGRISTLLSNWRETGDDNLIEVASFILEDYVEFEIEEEEQAEEPEDGQRH